MESETFDPGAAAAPGSGIYGLTTPPDQCRVQLIPVPFEATTSYGGGASKGPAAILAASKQVDLFDYHCGRPYEQGICMLPESEEIVKLNAKAKKAAQAVIAEGGRVEGDAQLKKKLDTVNEASERVNEIVYEEAKRILNEGRIPVVLGGDHAAPFGAIKAAAERTPGLGLLQIDAHADLRVAYEGFTWSHASIMHNVAQHCPNVQRIVQVGVRDFCEDELKAMRASLGRIVTHFDGDLARRQLSGPPFASISRRILRDLPNDVYVSVDIDGLDPTLCPHTGTPVPGGLNFAQFCVLIEDIVKSGRTIVGLDLCEVAPGPEGDEWDANVGARILYKLIGFTLRSQRRRGA